MVDIPIYYFFFENSIDRILLCVVGILLSVYALYVEIRKESDPTFKAVCDLGDNMSCSKVLTSKYGRGFGIVEFLVGKENFMNMRNCNLGIAFYSSQIILSFVPSFLFVLYWSSLISIFGCIYLAFILLFILKDLCILCLTSYVINGCILVLNYAAYHNMTI